MLLFKQCEIRDKAELREPIALVPDGKDVQVGRDGLVARLLVHLLGRQSELPANLFFGRVQRVLQLLGRGILIGSAIAEDMLPQLVETDRLPPRLRIQPGEVGDELHFFRIQMEWNAIAFPTWHMQRQAQLFELYWLLKVPVLG